MLYGNIYKRLCKRYNLPGQAHELTFSCYKNQRLLVKERTRRYLVEALQEAILKHKFELWAYVFMPDHVHLVIFPKEKNYEISKILLSIKQPVSRRAMDYLKIENPEGLRYLATGLQDRPYRFWQKGGGYDRNITSVEMLINSVKYIHNNPVRQGLVECAEHWEYSSAREWLGGDSGPISIDIQNFPSL